MVPLFLATTAFAGPQWTAWPPRDYLQHSLVSAVPRILDTYHPQTGRFGTEPWICTDQNVLFPLAAAWALKSEGNPYYHDAGLLQVIAKGGEALVDAQDKDGKWVFRKKDDSTWGMIHMPWTYSRWIRAYQLVGAALPEEAKQKWERGLLLGFHGIRKYAEGGVHNIPTHHAMALYLAGECFHNEDWKAAARRFMVKVVAAQNPAGYWSEHFGPVVGYNKVYVEALGIYSSHANDPAALEALRRAARFHAAILWPDGSAVSCIDERQIYHHSVDIGNVGFSWTPEGRGFLLCQVARFSRGGKEPVSADYAAAMLLYGGQGTGRAPAAAIDERTTLLSDGGALIRRRKPWQWALSGYTCKPVQSRWIQDRQNLIDVFHDKAGLVVGGGNTKLQPYWSTFTVGDPSLLKHRPGDESPDFVPAVDLLWTPESASLTAGPPTTVVLEYGKVRCSVSASVRKDGSLALTYRAPRGRRVEAHVPFLHRGTRLALASGETIRLGRKGFVLSADQLGDHFVYGGLKVTAPPGASLRWPARQHNPYTKDGHSSLPAAKLVLCLPFDSVASQQVILALQPRAPFEGLAFEAGDLPVSHSEGSYTKRLDNLGSRFLGRCKPGDWIAFELPPVKPGRYELLGEFVLAYSYGIVRVLLDGNPVGKPFDAYWEAVDAEGEQVSFGPVELAAGSHKVAVAIVGKNPKATDSWISIKRWLLRPLER